ncbi:MAG: CpaF/VirB11 family protein [bacterium]|nr:CpaF/VirB11 family protein [bacterium]
MKDNLFAQLDFGALHEYISNEDITDISYTNNGQIWLRSLTQGSYRVENPHINNATIEKLAFQCSNVMGTSFNNAHPFLDAESPELRLNFVHESIATNGIALVIRKTPAKIRLQEEKLLEDEYITKDIHDFLMKCVYGHCNIMVCGETGSGKTEFVKYLASHTRENEKIITIEDTLELHLDKIYPHRDIVAMKTNNIASYSDVLVTCMRQNPKWILLSEVRSAEAVSAVRNSISSGHNILSTIHSDKASAIPHRMYSLMETDLDVDQFLNTIYRYVQLGVHIKAYYSQKHGKFHREIDEITEFYIDDENKPVYNTIYRKWMNGKVTKKNPSKHLIDYLLAQNIDLDNTDFESDDDGISLETVMNGEIKEEPSSQSIEQTATAQVVDPLTVIAPKTEHVEINNSNIESLGPEILQDSFETLDTVPQVETLNIQPTMNMQSINLNNNLNSTPGNVTGDIR